MIVTGSSTIFFMSSRILEPTAEGARKVTSGSARSPDFTGMEIRNILGSGL